MTLSQSNRPMFRKVMMSLGREASLLSIIIKLMAAPLVKTVESVTEPNVVVTSVYWVPNPLGEVSVHPGDTNIPLSIVLSNSGEALFQASSGGSDTFFLGTIQPGPVSEAGCRAAEVGMEI